MSKFEDRLWREIVRKHGASLAQMSRPAAKRPRGARPRVVAGTSVGLALAGAAVALLLGAASSPPAFAVDRNADGSLTVSLRGIAAIHGANARLEALGIRARLVEIAPGCPVKALPPGAVKAMTLARGTAGRELPRSAVTRFDPRKIPPGKWQVIPTYRGASGRVQIARAHLMQGKAPTCFSALPAPPCHVSTFPQARRGAPIPAAAVRDRAERALAQALTYREVHRAKASRAPGPGTRAVPVPAWVVGCYVHAGPGSPAPGNTVKRGNSDAGGS